MIRQKFNKAERLNKKKIIDQLFEAGRSFSMFPYKVIWVETKHHEPFPVQIAFAVPKKNFKRAVDRNLLKRRTREAYRKNKSRLYEAMDEKKIALMLVYIAKEISDYATIESKINMVIERLMKEIDLTPTLSKGEGV